MNETKAFFKDVLHKGLLITLAIMIVIGLAGTIATRPGKQNPPTKRTEVSDPNLINYKPTTRWRLNSNGVSQKYIPLTGSRDDRMKGILKEYGFQEEMLASIKTIARIHKIKPEVIICIAYADSSLGKYLKTKNNIGNVGNNDRGDKVNYGNIEQGFNAIGKVLNNKYLSYIYTIDYLSRYHNKYGKVYATSPENQFINLSNCLGMLNEQGTGVSDKYQIRF